MLRVTWCIGFFWLIVPATSQALVQSNDSAAILRDAHRAQVRFEHTRRHYIPRLDDPNDDRCDVQIGRMCYLQGDDNQQPIAEPREIASARISFIARLATLHARSPGDDWIAGQLIHYMVEAGEYSGAVAMARACAPERWYCYALQGYALHASGSYGGADSAYDKALLAMPPEERCRWNDISLLLDDATRDSYERIPCGKRDSVEQRFWKLSRPSFLVGGNDRRTEHYSRVLLADLSQDADNPYDLRWRTDMREMLIRYGAAIWYSTPVPMPFLATPAPVGHDRAPSYHFAPEVLGDTVQWDVYAPAPREKYAPPYIDTLMKLVAQFAMMKRGDSALVVAVYADTARDTTQQQALIGLSAGVRDNTTSEEPRGVEHEGLRRVRAAWRGMMVAMETYDPVRRSDARTRQWLAPPRHPSDAPDVSTLLIYSADSSTTVESLDDALAQALTNNELRGIRRLGLYWEVYGVYRSPKDSSRPQDTVSTATDTSTATRLPGAADSSSVEVTVVRTDGGIARWLGQALHLTQRDSPLTVRWHDTHPGAGMDAHSVTVDLSALPSGDYRVTVTMGMAPDHRTELARDIRLR